MSHAELAILPKTKKQKQSVTSEWEILQDSIDGVVIEKTDAVLKGRSDAFGWTRELFRSDWQGFEQHQPKQSFVACYQRPGDLDFWHVHAKTWDCFSIVTGNCRIVLYDARPNSPTFDYISQHLIGQDRPRVILIPPGVYHGVENIGSGPLVLFNTVNYAYNYTDPDHWTIDKNTVEIPFCIKTYQRTRPIDQSEKRKSRAKIVLE